MRKQKHQNQKTETENQCLKHAADTPHAARICRELLVLNQWINAGIKMAYFRVYMEYYADKCFRTMVERNEQCERYLWTLLLMQFVECSSTDMGIELFVTGSVCNAKRGIIDMVMEFKVLKEHKIMDKNEKKKKKIIGIRPRFH